MDDNLPTTPPWSSDAPTGCPVGQAVQAWIETSMVWFAGQFGEEAASREVALPRPGFFPTAYAGEPEQIEALVLKVRDLMAVDSSQDLVVRVFDGSTETTVAGGRRAVGHYHEEDGRAIIGLDLREAADPAFLTAIIAHELCHVRLLGENRITAAQRDHERLTDLLTVYLGFGIFTTNAALHFTETARGWSVRPRGYLSEHDLNAARNDGYARLGYLTEAEFGYALACYCRLRGEDDPAWADHLDPGPRAFLQQGLAYLARMTPGDFPTVRTATARMSICVVPAVRSPASNFLLMAMPGDEKRLRLRPTWPLTGPGRTPSSTP
ncbi:hypothetical protein NE236_24745 [Actinoallomurus purpureus]|uniref:hypothetical protein n=1 Tax=Actinoallomurus purpureus TaxID=478114 RepID=UPI00209354E6|nr:hypothetical protein [Actinoallomurus purpureus]MCO6008192.1 hypothetical protein [Actinoallomurus purpureus]